MDRFRIDFSNICGLRANFDSALAHIRVHRPNVFALCETQVSTNCDPCNFRIAGYNLLPLFVNHRGLAIFIRDDVGFQYQQHLNSSVNEFNTLWVKFKLRSHTMHFGFVYRSPNTEELLPLMVSMHFPNQYLRFS